jgi:hypothetical protein
MEWKDIGAAPGLEVTRGRLAGDVAIELGEPPPSSPALTDEVSFNHSDDEAAVLQVDHCPRGSGRLNLYGPSRLPCRESDLAVVGANSAVEHGELDVDGSRVTIETAPSLALHHAMGEPDKALRGGTLPFHADRLPRA